MQLSNSNVCFLSQLPCFWFFFTFLLTPKPHLLLDMFLGPALFNFEIET